jgi:hypothetical protein
MQVSRRIRGGAVDTRRKCIFYKPLRASAPPRILRDIAFRAPPSRVTCI